MPFMKLNTTAVTSSQPPQMNAAARVEVGAGCAPGENDDGAETDDGGGQQPGDVGAHAVTEQPPQPTSKFMLPRPPGSSPVSRPNPL